MEVPRFEVDDNLIASIASLICEAASDTGNCDEVQCKNCVFNDPKEVKSFLGLDEISHRAGCKCHACWETKGCNEYHRKKED
jgi:hypothetical protein